MSKVVTVTQKQEVVDLVATVQNLSLALSKREEEVNDLDRLCDELSTECGDRDVVIAQLHAELEKYKGKVQSDDLLRQLTAALELTNKKHTAKNNNSSDRSEFYLKKREELRKKREAYVKEKLREVK